MANVRCWQKIFIPWYLPRPSDGMSYWHTWIVFNMLPVAWIVQLLSHSCHRVFIYFSTGQISLVVWSGVNNQLLWPSTVYRLYVVHPPYLCICAPLPCAARHFRSFMWTCWLSFLSATDIWSLIFALVNFAVLLVFWYSVLYFFYCYQKFIVCSGIETKELNSSS